MESQFLHIYIHIYIITHCAREDDAITVKVIASSECAKLKHTGLAKCVIIADHVTFSQSGGRFIVADLSTVRASSESLLCEWLEKAIVHHVIVIASLGEQKGKT